MMTSFQSLFLIVDILALCTSGLAATLACYACLKARAAPPDPA